MEQRLKVEHDLHSSQYLPKKVFTAEEMFTFSGEIQPTLLQPSDPGRSEFESQFLPYAAVYLWASHLIFLRFIFPMP